jgi:hypothetical protein
MRSYFDRGRDTGTLPVPPRLRRVLPLRADWKLGHEHLKVPGGLSRSKSTPSHGKQAWDEGYSVLYSAQNDINSQVCRSYFDRMRQRPSMSTSEPRQGPLAVTWKLDLDRRPEVRKAGEFFSPVWVAKDGPQLAI